MEIWRQFATAGFIVGVIGNLVASALWAPIALIHLHRKIDRHHREHMHLLRESAIMDSGGHDAVLSSEARRDRQL